MKVVLSIIISLFLIVSISEIVEICIIDSSNYPFGSDFFGRFSIYRSKNTYLIFNGVIAINGLLAFLNFRNKWFYIFTVIILLMEIYNVLT